jgi:hypothetical protein
MKTVLTRAIAVAALIVAACSHEDEQAPAQAPAPDPAFIAARHLAQQRLDFKNGMVDRLATLDARIEDVRARRSAMPSDQTLAQITSDRAELERISSKVDSADASTWQSEAADFDDRYSALSDRLDKERIDYRMSIPQRIAVLDAKLEDARSRRGDPASDPTLARLVKDRRGLVAAATRVKDADEEAWKEATTALERKIQEVSSAIEQERRDYVTAIINRVADLDRRVAVYMARPKTWGTKATREQIETLDGEIAAAAERVKNATESSWKEATSEFEQKFRNLKARLDAELGAKKK